MPVFRPPQRTGLVVRVQHDPRYHSVYAWIATEGCGYAPFVADIRFAKLYFDFDLAKAVADEQIAAGRPSLIWEVSISRSARQPDRPIRVVWPVENIVESIAALDRT